MFDRILMNPPFERGDDIRHIEHARKFLKPGGRLVAICADGPRQRERLQPIASQWRSLPAGTFKESGTMVNTALLVIDG
jgi:16S rRNA G1207 methylase RsmC